MRESVRERCNAADFLVCVALSVSYSHLVLLQQNRK